MKRLIEVLTLVGVIVYTVLTGCLLSLSHQSFVASQRAFVYLDKIEAVWVDTNTAVPGKIVNVTFFIGNSGNTPTKDLRMVAGCYPIGPGPLPREPFSTFKWQDTRVARLVIAPHQILAYPACRLTESDLQTSQMPFIHRYFIGEIRYLDIVSGGEEHVTQFDEELVVHDFDSRANRLNYETLLAGLHNCSDDECKNAKGDPGALAAPRWLTY